MEIYNRKNINTQKWDQLVWNSPNGLFYHLSDHLFSLNKEWEFQVVLGESGDYQMGIAFPIKRFLGLKRIIQPSFCQQLGFIGSRDIVIQDHFPEILTNSDRKISWAYNFNEGNSLQHLPAENSNWKKGTNLVLKLDKSLEEIQKSYSNNLSRKIKKAKASDLSFSPCSLDTIWTSLEKELLQTVSSLKKRSLSNLLSALKKDPPKSKAHFFQVLDKDGELLSGGIFIGFKNRLTYWSGFSTEAGKEHGAMAFLIDQAIMFSKAEFKEFDFESGNLPGTSRFFRQFKPEERAYMIYSKRL